MLGRAPSSLKLSGKSLADLKLPEVAPGLPSDLLLRRPDIKKAEANLIAANANVGVARAKMLPSFSLTGERGWASQLFDNLTAPASIYWTVAGAVATTIFDNGKTEADISYAKARFGELMEVYQQSILTSLRDTEDALAAVRLEGELEVAQQEVLQASLDAYRLSSEAFRLGMVDYLNVLETQRTRFQAEDAKVQSRFGRMSAVVSLYKALGGGMERPEEQVQQEDTPSESAQKVTEASANAERTLAAPITTIIPPMVPVSSLPEDNPPPKSAEAPTEIPPEAYYTGAN